jgi:hypothetical protein
VATAAGAAKAYLCKEPVLTNGSLCFDNIRLFLCPCSEAPPTS